MTENEAIKYLEKQIQIQPCGNVALAFEKAIQALEENQQYRAIGTVEECTELLEYRAIGSVDRIKGSIEANYVLLHAYESIGTIDEFKALKERGKILPIANISINKKVLQTMVDEKIKDVELDIKSIRNKAIDEFAERLKEEYGCLGYIDEITFEEIDKIAEEMRGAE